MPKVMIDSKELQELRDEVESHEKRDKEQRDHILRLTDALKETEVPELREQIQVLKCEMIGQSHKLLRSINATAYWKRLAERLQRAGGYEMEEMFTVTEDITIPVRCDNPADRHRQQQFFKRGYGKMG